MCEAEQILCEKILDIQNILSEEEEKIAYELWEEERAKEARKANWIHPQPKDENDESDDFHENHQDNNLSFKMTNPCFFCNKGSVTRNKRLKR